MNDVTTAAAEFLARKDRLLHPGGRADPRWYPSAKETQECCASIRRPSRAYPWSLMTHCRTAEHVANLHGVEVSAVRKAARTMPRGYVRIYAELTAEQLEALSPQTVEFAVVLLSDDPASSVAQALSMATLIADSSAGP